MGTLRRHLRVGLALLFAFCSTSSAWCFSDTYRFDTPAFGLFTAAFVTGTWLLLSPAVALVTWVAARLVRVEAAGYGRAWLLTATETALAGLALVFVPAGSFAHVLARGSIPVAAAAALGVIAARRVFSTTWGKASATCLLSWTMLAAVLATLFFLGESRP
jgi:hypothetical protein